MLNGIQNGGYAAYGLQNQVRPNQQNLDDPSANRTNQPLNEQNAKPNLAAGAAEKPTAPVNESGAAGFKPYSPGLQNQDLSASSFNRGSTLDITA